MVEHAVGPPEAETLRFDVVGGQAVEELVDDGLQPALRSSGSHLLAETFAALAREAHGLRAARRKRIHARDPRCPDSSNGFRALGMRRELHERVDGLRAASSPRGARSPRACRRSPRARADAWPGRRSSPRRRSARGRRSIVRVCPAGPWRMRPAAPPSGHRGWQARGPGPKPASAANLANRRAPGRGTDREIVVRMGADYTPPGTETWDRGAALEPEPEAGA